MIRKVVRALGAPNDIVSMDSDDQSGAEQDINEDAVFIQQEHLEIVNSLSKKKVRNRLPRSGRDLAEEAEDEDDPFDSVRGSNQALIKAE